MLCRWFCLISKDLLLVISPRILSFTCPELQAHTQCHSCVGVHGVCVTTSVQLKAEVLDCNLAGFQHSTAYFS